jgi:UDP-N-acetylmuramoyl-L-alanyl-D-glutamate--2,6-diaminopimelate ligase
MKSAIEIAPALEGARVLGDPNVLIGGVTHDSRQVEPGDLFAVLRGAKADGRAYVKDAMKKGAAALLVDEVVDADLPQIVVRDVRYALGFAAAECYDRPTEKSALVGVTGTNGKTTIVYLVESALKALGKRPGIMSTVAYRFEENSWDAGFTTPEAPVIQATAAKMLGKGATHLIMESSSHGIVQHRLNGCLYQVAAFTNLTQDHLDFHHTMEEYGAVKLRLFTDLLERNPKGRAVVNADDPFSKTILSNVKKPVITVSVHAESDADIRPSAPPEYTIQGISADIRLGEGTYHLKSPLIGAHNLSNLLVALGILMQLGEKAEAAVAALTSSGAPGRLERVSKEGEPTVLVDYAHTPDALVNVLAALRPLTKGRLICVFGCGGDRDNKKRPIMGSAVRDASDLAVVTSDNPRTENPNTIIDMILPGIEGGNMPRVDVSKLSILSRGFAVEPDRRLAVSAAILAAKEDDTVLIAGKGHEDYQILGTTKTHFDDREEARAALNRMKKGA